jgi:hypothetical protein
MIKLFKNIRRSLISENNTTKYLKYAIGEIALVVIGILLALQINNWNEIRLQKNEFHNILETISKDLKRDTLVAGIIIKYYEKVEENSMKIINKEINRNNYKEYPDARSIVSRYRSFTIQRKGFEMVKDYSSKNEISNDSIFTSISQFYTPFLQIIDDSNGFVKKEVLNNIETYKKYDWYVDWTQGKFTPEMVIYFTESEEYRKQVASHNLLAGKNHLLFIKAYKTNAIKLIDYIDEYLKEHK